MAEPKPKPSLSSVSRGLVALGTLGVLAHFGFRLVSLAFRLGPRVGVRSAVGLVLPMLAGCFAFVSRRDALRRIRTLPVAALFSISLVLGAAGMASVRLFLPLQPFPIAELLIASCFAAVAFASDSVPGLSLDGTATPSHQPLALCLGMAAGMLSYVALFGVPRILPG